MSSDGPRTTTIDKGDIRLHMFTSPEVGEMVNSHVIETPNALIVVDVPLYKPFAEAFRTYLDGLGKPIAKILITHAHPDHWFTVSQFQDHATFAFQEALDEMAVLKDLAYGYHSSIHPDLVPDVVTLPSDVAEEGPIEIDGVTLILHKVRDAEATATMAVEIPAINTLIAQDLVYDRCYAYVATKDAAGESTIGSWIGHLEALARRDFDLVLPAHGEASDSSIFDANIAYLRFAADVLASARTGDDMIRQFKERYPDYRLDLMLTMSAYMLYPSAEA